MFDGLGQSLSREVSGYLRSGAVHVYPLTAVKADLRRQNFSTFPKQFYLDVTFGCRRCGTEFLFSAREQREWYEQLGFYIDSEPRECPACRRALRELKSLKQEYDRDVAAAEEPKTAAGQKQRLLEVIDALTAGGVKATARMDAARHKLVGQIERLRRADGV